MELNRKINLITGHYGSGKTNLAVNLALDERRRGKTVTLVDLDIVNPYFRSADFAELLEDAGIQVVLPLYANSNLDIPSLTGAVDAAFGGESDCVILDVGGDDAGAIALGRYASRVEALSYDFFYVINSSRYLTRTPDDALSVLRDIQAVSRLTPTGILNNANLGEETTAKLVEDSMDFAREVAREAKLPLCATAFDRSLTPEVPDAYPVTIYVKKIWDV